jgi:hypothetical protein
MSRIRVAFCESSAQAVPLVQLLLQAGVRAQIRNESRLANFWYVSTKRAGSRIEVSAEDVARARQLLLEWDTKQGLLQSTIRCPECKSLRVDYPQFTEKSLFTNFAMGLAAEFRLVELSYYCEDCHFMWVRQPARQARARHHLAPDYFLERV